MREIKFRAWDGKAKCMVDWLCMRQTAFNSSLGDSYINLMYDIFTNFNGKITIMQYTGLKDKNGVDIYEGDVVQWFRLKLVISVDDYHGYRFMAGKDQLTRGIGIDGEIIGNIYTNPELLED